MIAEKLYLQSECSKSFSTVAERIGRVSLSPTLSIILSIEFIPKRVVSKSASSSISSLNPSGGYFHSSVMSSSISIMCLNTISINLEI